MKRTASAASRPLTDEQAHILKTIAELEGRPAARAMYRTWFGTTDGAEATIEDVCRDRKPGRTRPEPVIEDYEQAILSEQEEDESWWG